MNSITLTFGDETNITSTEKFTQFDYGQQIIFADLELPTPFECHLSNVKLGKAVTVIGEDNAIEVPNELLSTGLPLYGWVFLHESVNDGETEYTFKIKVTRRAIPKDTITPEQQSAITRAIALLQHPIDNIEEIVNEALSYTTVTLEELQAMDAELKGDITTADANIATNTEDIATNASDIVTLNARVDNLAQLEEGSTTGDAELIDGRVGADGVTYTNIGGAIRSQVNDLKSALGDFQWRKIAVSRFIDIPISVSEGDILYFKPLVWTGDEVAGITISGYKNGQLGSAFTSVPSVGVEAFYTATANDNYESLRVSASTASAPSTVQTFEVVLANIGNLESLSQYVLNNRRDIADINGKLQKCVKCGYGFNSADSVVAPFDDLDTFPQNTIASYVTSAANVTAHTPVKSWFSIICLNYQVSAVNRSSSMQIAWEVNTGNIFKRINNGSGWSVWTSENVPIYVSKSGKYNNIVAFTTFKEGIEAAYANKNCKLYIADGEYDILDEYGSEWLEEYDQNKACGPLIGNGIEVEFSNNAKLIANYSGNNDLIKQYFSPLNVTGSFKLVNANIEVTNVRYCVHEDITTIATVPSNYKAEYIDCRMKHNGNNLSGWTSNFCLGCGASPNGRSVVIGGMYVANNSRHVPIFWHNSGNDTYPSYVRIDSVALGANDHFHFRRGAENGNTVIVEITNCLIGAETTYADGAPDKFTITEWNNVLNNNFRYRGYLDATVNVNNVVKDGWYLIALSRISTMSGLPSDLSTDAVLQVYSGSLTLQTITELSAPYRQYQRYLYNNNQSQSVWITTRLRIRKKTMYIFGDSLAKGVLGTGGNGKSYLEIAAQKNGYDVVNCGVGGIGYVYSAKKLVSEVPWNTSEGRIRAQDVIDHYASELVNADTVVLAYGVNDWQTLGDPNVTIAEADRRATSENIIANVKTAIYSIMTAHIGARIIVVTPVNTSYRGGSRASGWGLETSLNNNNDGREAMTLEKTYQAIVDACNYYGVEYVDMTHNNAAVNYININNVLPDHLHPSQTTYERLADSIKL